MQRTSTLENDLYVIHVDTQLKTQGAQIKSQQTQATTANVVFCHRTSNLTLWNQRLGHLPVTILRTLSCCKHMFSSFTDICIVCPLAKQVRLPFPLSTTTTPYITC